MKRNTAQDYLNFLQKVKESIDSGGRTPLTTFAKGAGIHSNVSIVMCDNGIIEKVDFATYVWKTPVPPNIKMAERIKSEVDKKMRQYKPLKKVRKVKKTEPYVHLETKPMPVEKKKPIKPKKSWSLLFGLFTKYK